MLQAYVSSVSGLSYVCCKCFNCFQMYVASVSTECCKSRSGVTHAANRTTCRSSLMQLLGLHRAGAESPRLHARGKRTRHERSLCVVGQVGGASGPGARGPCVGAPGCTHGKRGARIDIRTGPTVRTSGR